MSIYFKLFLTFFKIGLFTFGGGYAMIPLVKSETISLGWITEDTFINFIAVAESTPGPIAINMATFIGSTNAGILGAICATFGVILPSFIIILLIASVLKKFLQLAGVQAFIKGIHPTITALILSTGLTILLSSLFSIKTIESKINFDYKALIILAVIILFTLLYKKAFKKKPSAIIIIILSAILGIVLYSF